jgi:hypothetical protein
LILQAPIAQILNEEVSIFNDFNEKFNTNSDSSSSSNINENIAINTNIKQDEVQDNNNQVSSSSSSSLLSVQLKDSPTLKRTHAIPDIHRMDDFSPVTFTLSNQFNKIDENDDNSTNIVEDYIEENKIVISGIKVRAAKLDRLLRILTESFGKLF